MTLRAPLRSALCFIAALALAPGFACAQGLPSANQVYAGPTSGPPSAPSFRALVPADVPIGSTLDSIGSTRGSILERGASTWGIVTPGTSGLPWVSNGTGADPGYQALTGGGIASGTVANSNLVNMAAGTVKCEPGAGGTGAPQDCSYATAGLPNSVKAAGALGNSNGTHGNGNDDTSAISTAMDNADDVYFPCGTYRITSTIIKTSTTKYYRFHGNGECSKIYFDNSVSQPVFQFSPASICGPCVRVEYLNFIQPNTSGGSTAAVSLTNETQAVFSYNLMAGGNWGTGLVLSSGDFAPVVIGNRATSLSGGFIFVGGTDATLNNAKIWLNTIQSSGSSTSSPALPLNCGTGANNISVIGNDLESNFAGVIFSNGCTSVDLSDNYIENSTGDNFNFSGTASSGVTIRNNWFGAAGASSIANVSKLVFGANTLFNWSVTWAASATTPIFVEPTNVLLGTASLGSPISTWTAFTPSPSCGTATFTVNSARSFTLNNITTIEGDITISAIGTCTQPVNFTLPKTPNSTGVLAGAESSSGKGLYCLVLSGSTTAQCTKADVSAFAPSNVIRFSGVFENQ
jgi:hypothetical protein